MKNHTDPEICPVDGRSPSPVTSDTSKSLGAILEGVGVLSPEVATAIATIAQYLRSENLEFARIRSNTEAEFCPLTVHEAAFELGKTHTEQAICGLLVMAIERNNNPENPIGTECKAVLSKILKQIQTGGYAQ